MLVILTTHPIQYQVPLWKTLATNGSVHFEVWYLTDHGVRSSYDVEFGRSFAWDLDMLSGYPHRFLNQDSGIGVHRFWSTRLPGSFARLLQEKQVSVLWIQGWQVLAYWQAAFQAHARGIPVWLRGESNDLAPLPIWKKGLKRMILGSLFRRVSEFLYIGQANRRLYQRYGVPVDHLHAAPYCVDNKRFERQALAQRPLRNKTRRGWHIPEESFCILFVGKFIPKKRPADIVTAALRFSKDNGSRPVHLLFVGSGVLGRELRDQCNVVFDAEAGGTVVVTNGTRRPTASFAGFLNQTEISAAYVAADCLVLPSDHGETWGLVVNEAMASGLACVVSDACGCSEDLVEPLRKALRFPLGDIPALVSALHDLESYPIAVETLRNQVEQYSLQVSRGTVSGCYAKLTHI